MATAAVETRFLLDTNIISDLVRNPQGSVARHVRRVGDDAICTSIVVSAELRYGAAKRKSKRLIEQLDLVLQNIDILPLAADADRHYGDLRVALEAGGTPIGGNDMLIAAQCLSLGLTLNESEFGRIASLSIENWIRD
jgi:tRNA(fMet)-specific endonuclease VapC